MRHHSKFPATSKRFEKWAFSLLVVAGVLLGGSSPARAGGYFLRVLVTTGDTIEGRTLFSVRGFPALNDRGEVLFKARTGALGNFEEGIFTPDARIVARGDVIDSREVIDVFVGSIDVPISLNNNGEVAFRAMFRDPSGDFSGLATQFRLLVRPGDEISGKTLAFVGAFPDLNDNGVLAFRGFFDAGSGPFSGAGVFTQDRLVAATGETVAGRLLNGVTVPSIANAGRVAYGAQFELGGDPFSSGNFVEDAVLVKRGDVIDGWSLINVFPPSVNNGGDIAFVAQIAAGPNRHGVFTQSRVVAAPGMTVDGKLITEVSSATIPALTDSGVVGFTALIDVVGLPFAVGIFAGERLVVATGDVIDGKTVDTLEANGVLAMNSKAQVAFVANFVDGTSAVVLATPLRPDLLTELVEELIDEGALDPSRGEVLLRKIADAQGKLDEGKTKTAINQLGAFINIVQSLVNSGELSAEEGGLLIDAARQLIAELEG